MLSLFFVTLRTAQFQLVYLSLAPTPREILDTLCAEILNASVLSVGYFTNSETFGSNAASVEYVHQLLGYLGIPVISWNPDNIALDEVGRGDRSGRQAKREVAGRLPMSCRCSGRAYASTVSTELLYLRSSVRSFFLPSPTCLVQRVTDAHILGLSPSVDHQVNSIFDFLDRYQWTQFAIITTQLAGHENFIRAMREKVFQKQHK